MSQLKFDEWFAEYCEGDCPTEGYDDALVAAKAAFNAQQAIIDQLKKDHKKELNDVATTYRTNMTTVELNNAVKFVTENNLEMFSLLHRRGSIGSSIGIGTSYDAPHVDITDYESW